MDGRYRFHLDTPDGVVQVAHQSMHDSGAGFELHAGWYYLIEQRLARIATFGARAPGDGGQPLRVLGVIRQRPFPQRLTLRG